MSYQKYRSELLEKYNYCCAWCGDMSSLQIDHVQTQFSGGTDQLENLQILCKRCNCTKGKYVLPKLKPRQPQLDRFKCERRKMVLRRVVMPFRRTQNPYFFVPKKVALGK